MSDSNKTIGLDIKSSYDGKGSEEAKRDINALGAETSRAGAAARETAQHHEGLATAVNGLRIAAGAGVITVGALAIATINLSQAWARSAEAVGSLAEKTEMSVEELSLMRLEAEQNNTSIDKLATGMKNLSVKMFEANSGNKQAQALFRALNVEYTDSAGNLRNVREVMDEVSTVFSRMEGGAGKTAVASKLLGKNIGEDLIPYLNQGGEKLKALREEADKLGLKMDGDTVKSIKGLNDDLKILRMSAEAAAGEFAGPLVRSLARVVEEIRNGRRESGWLMALLRGGEAAVGEVFVGESIPALRQREATFKQRITMNERRLKNASSPAAQERIQAQINEEYRNLAGVYKRIGEVEGSGVEDDTPKAPAPTGLDKEGRTGGRAGKAPMTFEELMQKARDKRQSVYEDNERTAGAAAERDADAQERAAKRESEALDKLAQKYRDLVNPMLPLQREIEQIDNLLDNGKITLDDYGQMVSNVQVRMVALNEKSREVKDGGLADLTNAIHGYGRDASRDIGRMVVDGEFSLKRLGNAFKSLAADIIASRVQKQWMDPLISAGLQGLTGMFGGAGGGDADIQGGEDFYGNPVRNAYGNAFGPRGVVPFAQGGVVRRPTLFKFANGGAVGNGLMGEAGEEGILPLKRGRDGKLGVISSGGAGNVRVEIINQGQPQEVASATPMFDADGMVVQIVLRDLRTGGPIRGAIETLGQPVM